MRVAKALARVPRALGALVALRVYFGRSALGMEELSQRDHV